MSQRGMRTFSTEFKQAVVLRLEAGERIAAVADELKIRRKLLYEWRAAYRKLGASGLNRKRGRQLGGVSRAGFYRFGEVRAPQRTEADLRDKIQTIALDNRFYGYRRVCRDLWRIHGLKVNHKHVLRLMREDNLLCLRQKP